MDWLAGMKVMSAAPLGTGLTGALSLAVAGQRDVQPAPPDRSRTVGSGHTPPLQNPVVLRCRLLPLVCTL